MMMMMTASTLNSFTITTDGSQPFKTINNFIKRRRKVTIYESNPHLRKGSAAKKKIFFSKLLKVLSNNNKINSVCVCETIGLDFSSKALCPFLRNTVSVTKMFLASE